ncbi:MAG: endonuclease III [Verrucomicrobia bacterium]|nr:endonuclease III [Verrucomicrobiota bacterium]
MKITTAIRALEKAYGEKVRTRLDDPLESLVLTVLSQNTNDVNRDRAYDTMRERFPTWDDVATASARKLADAIRVGGIANVKSVRIQRILRQIKEQFGGYDLTALRERPPEEVEAILGGFDGVGLKTVKVVQVFALGQDVFPVDTHIFRLSKRMGFVEQKATRERAHEVMGRLVPAPKAYSFHLNMIEHGRRVCRAPRALCGACMLRRSCPKVGVPVEEMERR